jgi:hypothetical protein
LLRGENEEIELLREEEKSLFLMVDLLEVMVEKVEMLL